MKSSSIHTEKQNGQAIVLVAITMVILLAFTGLAIDGGNALLTYRNVQNAVDSASLTAAFTMCSSEGSTEDQRRQAAITAAERSLALNGIDGTVAGVTAEVHSPPIYTSNNSLKNNDHIEVFVRVQNPSYFIQVVYDGPIVISADAISRCQIGVTVQPGPNTVSNRQAVGSFAPEGTCSSYSVSFSGSKYAIYGDVYVSDNANGGGDFQNNPVNGNIYIRDDGGRNNQVVDFREVAPGDGIITEDYSGPAVSEPYDWGDFAPGGAIEEALGGRNRPVGHPLYDPNGLYIDLSDRCAGNKVDHQVFRDYGSLVGNVLSIDTAVYYASCDMQIDRNFQGSATFITAGKIETSMTVNLTHFDFTGYDLSAAVSVEPIEEVLFVSNSGNESSNCNSADHAIRVTGDDHQTTGDIVAFRGLITLDGNDNTFDSCVMGWSVRLNAGEGSTITCQPGVSATNTQTNFGIVE